MVFFDLRALAHPPQLDQRVAGVGLVLGQHDLRLIRAGDQPELRELRVGQEVQRDEIRARFLERGVLLLERRLRIAVQPLRDLARGVADHLVHVRSVSSPATLLHFSARAASSGVHENSLRNSGSVDLSYASLTFDSDTDLLP